MPFKDPIKRKAMHKKYAKRWYEKNRAVTIKRTAERKKKSRAKWIAFKAVQKCSKCGSCHPAIIDFHHIDKRDKKAIPKLINRGQFTMALREAQEKCIPLCANCHRVLHWDEHRRKKNDRPTKSRNGSVGVPRASS